MYGAILVPVPSPVWPSYRPASSSLSVDLPVSSVVSPSQPGRVERGGGGAVTGVSQYLSS